MRDVVVPPLLKPGDRVGLAATARSVSYADVELAVNLLESWGLEVVVPDGLFAVSGQLAGSDQHRASVFQKLLDDNEIKAIFCARGGYGTVRIIDKLDFSKLRKFPKWIVGYSDVTVLHSHISKVCAVATLHATMPINFPPLSNAMCAPSISSLYNWIFNGSCFIEFDGGCRSVVGVADAEVVGGNLSILYSLCGSPSAIDAKGKILLIEDLDEYLYHIDRMMRNLDRNGVLKDLSGIIVGGMTEMHDNVVPFTDERDGAYAIIDDVVSKYSYPVAYGAPIGHLGIENRAIPLGIKIHMSVDMSKKVCIFAH